MKRIVICDANILIDYAKANKKLIGVINKELYEICVPLPVWAEVKDLTREDAKTLGINIIEPSLNQLLDAAQMFGGGLSSEDHLCFVMARDNKVICATNEKPLRQKCIASGIEVLWGLEFMLQLCKIGKLKADLAQKTAEQIVEINPRMTQKILKDFIGKLKNIG